MTAASYHAPHHLADSAGLSTDTERIHRLWQVAWRRQGVLWRLEQRHGFDVPPSVNRPLSNDLDMVDAVIAELIVGVFDD